MKGEVYTGNLDLIVTHYKEPWSVGKKFFDMLALQRDINFDDVGVILVNDGEENGTLTRFARSAFRMEAYQKPGMPDWMHLMRIG